MPGPIQISHDVHAPAEVVWQVITDIEHAPEFISGIESVERLDDGTGFGVGTRWRETRTMFGRTATEDMTVTAVEPGRSYTTEAHHGKAHYTSGLRVEPKGDADSVVSMHFDAEVSGLLNKTLGAVVGKLFEGSTRKAMQQDLADIAAAAENR
jgi:carbon monoxide dehydrogenase subunit G